MDDGQEPVATTVTRSHTRRALLAGATAAAAAGAAAAIVGIATHGGGDSDSSPASSSGGGAGPWPTVDPEAQIADPKRRAAHLLRRAGFGGTQAEIDEFAGLTREEAADRLLDFERIDNSALDARIAAADFNLTVPGPKADGRGVLQIDMQRWWLTRMACTARPLEERMTLTWHGLLTSQVSKIGGQRAHLMVAQNELFRAHALPPYGDLLKAIGKDPAMMIYLDTIQNARQAPNENYARELMELFSMGVGNYTEEDVRESARAFTGWRITPPERKPVPEGLTEQERRAFQNQLYSEYQPTFVVAERQHDTGQKTFLGKTGDWDGDDVVDIIMGHPATPSFITRRLFTEFANFNPSAETIERLVGVWNASGGSVREVVRAILVSDEFYSERSYRAIVRSPVELMANMVRALEIDTSFQGIERTMRGMDQVLFEPPSVAGWPGGANWLSSSTFFGRVNFVDQFLMPRGRPVQIPALAAATSTDDLVDRALAVLVDGNVSTRSRDSLREYAASVANPEERAAGVAYLVLASPEYQLV